MGIGNIESYLPIELERNIIILSYIISSIITIGLFLLKAVAIRTLAKNQGLDKLYLAWIPFFNYILLGEVIGVCFLFRKKVNNVGLLVAIATLVSFILRTFLNLGYYAYELGQLFSFTIEYDSAFVASWMAQTGVFYKTITVIYDIWAIIEIVVMASLIFFIFRKYVPERAFIYSIISIFFEFMFGPLLFVIRNKKSSNFDEFLRTSVKSGYNTYENVYKEQNNKPENDPFPEFSNKGGNNNSENTNNNNSDDFFN